MNTYAIQLVLHFQSNHSDDKRFEAFLVDVRSAAERHGISFDDYQSMQLSGSDYKIMACARCGHLTANREDLREGIENMLPDFWFYVRRGKMVERALVCELCSAASQAT